MTNKTCACSILMAWLAACGDPDLTPVAAPDDGVLAPDSSAPSARPFPQHSAYRAGALRPSQHSQAQLDEHVRAYYSAWRARYLVQVPGANPPQLYVYYNREGASDPKDAVSVSEGHGYGMLAAVLMAGAEPHAKSDFDALYRFYKAHPSAYTPGLMAWQQVRRGGKVIDNPDGGRDSATDGDLDIGYALLLADRQWGSAGPIPYKRAALASIQGSLRGAVNAQREILKLGDWASDRDKKYGGGTRSSDFMLDHLLAFAAADAAHAGQWRAVYARTADIVNYQLRSGGSQSTGLLPDFLVADASGHYAPAPSGYLEGKHDGDYGYNACRTPWRLGMADLLHGAADVRPALLTLDRWFRQQTGGDPQKVRAGYYVRNGQNGAPYVSYGDLSFTAPLLVSAMLDASGQTWLNALWDHAASAPIDKNDYYGNTIKLLVMIVASGNFWAPI